MTRRISRPLRLERLEDRLVPAPTLPLAREATQVALVQPPHPGAVSDFLLGILTAQLGENGVPMPPVSERPPDGIFRPPLPTRPEDLPDQGSLRFLPLFALLAPPLLLEKTEPENEVTDAPPTLEPSPPVVPVLLTGNDAVPRPKSEAEPLPPSVGRREQEGTVPAQPATPSTEPLTAVLEMSLPTISEALPSTPAVPAEAKPASSVGAGLSGPLFTDPTLAPHYAPRLGGSAGLDDLDLPMIAPGASRSETATE